MGVWYSEDTRRRDEVVSSLEQGLNMKMVTTFSELFSQTLAGKRIEPLKRVKSLLHVPRGRRNIPPSPQYIWHRFPIKDGISGSDLVAENITRTNPLFKRLYSQSIPPVS